MRPEPALDMTPLLRDIRRACRDRLLPWFARRKRTLPWRRRRTPYRVWIAEVMLQQTRVDQVRPYYDRFMKRFPSLASLARARRREVLTLWEGLGYYARARRMHETAMALVRDHGGRFPRTLEGLLSLPGVGGYTAAAVASLAMHKDVAVLDGNVARVLARLLAYDRPVDASEGRRHLQACADALLIPGRAASFNEAMMELGALCCLPRSPQCEACPMRPVCRAHAAGSPLAYPVKRRRRAVPHKVVGAAVVVNHRQQILLAQRHEHDMLGGLWEFPGGKREPGESMPGCIRRELMEELGIRVRVGGLLMVVHHAYSHFTMDLHVHWARIESGRPRALDCADWVWVPRAGLSRYPMSRADARVREALQKDGMDACLPGRKG